MHDPKLTLIEEVRKTITGYTSDDFTFQNLAQDLNKPTDLLISTFATESVLVEEILNFEQQNLENIFIEADFTGINAIDGLLHVSKEIGIKLDSLLPSITFDLRHKFPEVRQRFVERRISFVDSKIKGNFEDGMAEGMYRPDLSPELISRLYISRLLDFQNPDFFPNESISFSVVFDVLFDTFVRGICTDEGKRYYEKRIKFMKF